MAGRVSIGLPVYNGEAFVRETVELLQTYEDFELIICDNASIDSTPEICRTYAVRDCRVRYHRNERNGGAARNVNRTFELSRSEYHKRAAYGDVCAPEFPETCMDALDRNASAVVGSRQTFAGPGAHPWVSGQSLVEATVLMQWKPIRRRRRPVLGRGVAS